MVVFVQRRRWTDLLFFSADPSRLSLGVIPVLFPPMNSRPHKQSMSELKLRRLAEHNQRLREDLARPRMRVSEASAKYVFRLLHRRSRPTVVR